MTQKLEALHLEALCNEVRKRRAYDYLYHLVSKTIFSLGSVFLLRFSSSKFQVQPIMSSLI